MNGKSLVIWYSDNGIPSCAFISHTDEVLDPNVITDQMLEGWREDGTCFIVDMSGAKEYEPIVSTEDEECTRQYIVIDTSSSPL